MMIQIYKVLDRDANGPTLLKPFREAFASATLFGLDLPGLPADATLLLENKDGRLEVSAPGFHISQVPMRRLRRDVLCAIDEWGAAFFDALSTSRKLDVHDAVLYDPDTPHCINPETTPQVVGGGPVIGPSVAPEATSVA